MTTPISLVNDVTAWSSFGISQAVTEAEDPGPEYRALCFACGAEFTFNSSGRYRCDACDISWIEPSQYWQSVRSWDKYYGNILCDLEALRLRYGVEEFMDHSQQGTPPSPA